MNFRNFQPNTSKKLKMNESTLKQSPCDCKKKILYLKSKLKSNSQ